MTEAVTSIDFTRHAFASETGVVTIFLMTITHEGLDQPIMVSTDPTQRLEETSSDVIYGTVSRGNQFIYLPVVLELPSDTEEGPKIMRITIDNVSQQIGSTVRQMVGPFRMSCEFVLSDDTDTVMATWPDYVLTNVRTNEMTVSAEVVVDMMFSEPFPAGTFNPAEFPGLF
jgi:hypothetical protein